MSLSIREEALEILPLVETKMGRVITNSRAVADYFEKRHADVLRDIRALDCSPQFHERNFAPFKINDLTGTSTSHYEMTRDGFFFLAMGYTGTRAARLKEAYISRFNEMEETLRNAHRTGYLGQVVVKEFALNGQRLHAHYVQPRNR